jgi:hypothetical protein
MIRDNKLKLHYNKEINDIEGTLPLSENEGRWDLYLLFYHFISLKGLREKDKSLLNELEERGYDLTTINFSIEKADKDYKKIANNIGMNLHPDFTEWLLNLKGYGLRLVSITKDELIFKNYKNYQIAFNKTKRGSWYFKNEEGLVMFAETMRLFLGFLDFLEDYKFKNEDFDLEHFEETIYSD